jgi:hypothetical protein
MTDKRNCDICKTHYVLRGTPDGGQAWSPDCTCEADAARREATQRVVDRVRGPLDESFRRLMEGRKDQPSGG